MKPRAVLIGPPAAGKSRLGRRIAARLGVGFVDTDKLVIAEHGPIPEIFDNVGEPTFRIWERAAVVTALATDGIVALGGGAILDVDTRLDLSGHNVFLITATPEAIESRLTAGNRPLLSDGIESWKRLVALRQPIYDELSRFTVDTSKGTMDAIADEIANRLMVAS